MGKWYVNESTDIVRDAWFEQKVTALYVKEMKNRYVALRVIWTTESDIIARDGKCRYDCPRAYLRKKGLVEEQK